jgi:hypothetical protein
MKNIFLLFIIAFSALQLSSQQIVDSIKIWSNMQEFCHPDSSVYSTSYNKFYGDTLINDTLYKKVWISDEEDHENWYFYGTFIREENNSVYYREMFQNEGLIYDFNLGLGDSVFLSNPRAATNLWLTLTEIDSVEITDGFRERWKLESSEYSKDEYWIMGIGSGAGVLNSGTQIFGGMCGLYTLLCEKENDETIYQNPLFETCYVKRVIGINERVANKTNLFKLVNKQKLQQIELQFLTQGRKNISIVSLSGNTVFSTSTNEESLSINTGALSPGLYIINCLNQGAQQNTKFIK